MVAIISNINNIKMKSVMDIKYCLQGDSCTAFDFYDLLSLTLKETINHIV